MFLSMITQTSHALSLVLSTQIFFSPNFKNFSFIEFHETSSPTSDCINIFSYETHEIHIIFDQKMFLHDPTWKYHRVYSSSKFQLLVEFSPSAHEIGCLSCSSSLWVLKSSQLWFAWKVVKKYNTSKNSHWISRNVFNTSNFLAIFLWLFTLPGH
jgi:hypothetical protein